MSITIDDVQEHRPGVVDADDLERLAADLERVADLARLAVGPGWSRAILRLMTMFGFPRSLGLRNRPSLMALGKTALLSWAWVAMSCPWITGWSRIDPASDLPRATAIMKPFPSTVGAISQTSGATTRTPGIARIFGSRAAGRSLKAGLGRVLADDHHPLDLARACRRPCSAAPARR